MILVLASAVVLAAAAPPEPAPVHGPPAAAAPASHGPPLAGAPPVARRGPCDSLDAADIPACADHARPVTPAPASQPRPEPKAKPEALAPQKAAPVAAAKPKTTPGPPPRPVPPPSALAIALGAIERNPIAVGAGGGALVLLAALGGWALIGRRSPAAPNLGKPSASTPTPFRRDLVLIDAEGQGRRLPGPSLTPLAWAGAHAKDDLPLDGDGVAPRHVQFWVSEGRLMLRKAADAPVFLNDRLLKDTTAEVVSTGDRLQLGRAGFTILID